MSAENSYRVIAKNEDGLEVLEFDEDADITNSPIDLKERTNADHRIDRSAAESPEPQIWVTRQRGLMQISFSYEPTCGVDG
jgi:hypothetical protein